MDLPYLSEHDDWSSFLEVQTLNKSKQILKWSSESGAATNNNFNLLVVIV